MAQIAEVIKYEGDNSTFIVAISAGRSHTVGLKSDGTAVAVGRNYDNEYDVQVWTGIKLPKNK